MYNVLLTFYLIIAIILIALIMLQQSKSPNSGISFKANDFHTFFNSHRSGSFMTRMTAILAALFFGINLILSNVNNNSKIKNGSKWRSLTTELPKIEQTSPVTSTNDIPR